MATKKPNTATVCEALAKDLLAKLGVTLWDVRFEKEGSTWYLRYYIDKDGGVDINDCEHFSRGVDKLLDAADPIEQSYCLEVSSPGVERELTRPWHFEQCKGQKVFVRMVRPIEGIRDFEGQLTGYTDGQVTILLNEESEMSFALQEAAYVRLFDTYNYGGQDQ